MGLIVKDRIVTPQGIYLQNLYATCKSSYNLLKQQDGRYLLKTVFYYYYNKNKQHLFTEEVKSFITLQQISGNLVAVLYDLLKEKYRDYEEVYEQGQQDEEEDVPDV